MIKVLHVFQAVLWLTLWNLGAMWAPNFKKFTGPHWNLGAHIIPIWANKKKENINIEFL
jgi:hypothetical protein